MPSIGAPELIILLVVILLLFGAKKLPDLARSIGKSTSEFKKGMQDGGSEDSDPAEKSESSDKPEKSEKQSE